MDPFGQAWSNVLVQQRFPLDPPSVRDTRAFVRTVLRAAGRDDAIDAALLVVSELATNAVEHGGTGFGVTVDASVGVRLAVEDGGSGLPVQQSADTASVSGRGLALLARLGQWGVEALPVGKRVWWQLDESDDGG